MTAAFSSARGQAIVLVVHLAALVAGLVYAASLLSDVMAQRTAVEQRRLTVEQINRRLVAGVAHPSPLSQPVDPFMAGASLTVVGANLQDEVVSAIRSAGGTVTSSQIDTGGAAADPAAPVLLTVTCQLSEDAVQGLLYRLEADAPARFIDQLSIEAGDNGGSRSTGERLKMSMTVSAYWNGERKK